MSKATIQYKGFSLEITFDYSPPEKQTLEHPGCCEDFEIEKVELDYSENPSHENWNGKRVMIDITDLMEPDFEGIIEALKELRE